MTRATLNYVSTHGWKMNCVKCGEAVDARRWALGIYLCMPCGEANAQQVVRCIVPLHKSNYILVTDLEDLKGINNKGGFYR
jgi:hypothetical protein